MVQGKNKRSTNLPTNSNQELPKYNGIGIKKPKGSGDERSFMIVEK